MTYLRNVWYVAAWANQVTSGKALPRTILGEGVLLFRDNSGRTFALRDRCPHRYAPLHLGKLKDGVVECGYHGLQFNGQGSCVFNPHGDGKIPPNAKVKSYPIEERYEALWIWMGEPEHADASLIPDFSEVFNGTNTIVRHYLRPEANYELMIDNLLDLGHTAYLHPDSLGSEAMIKSTRHTNIVGDTVVDELWAPDGEAPPLAQFMLPRFRGGVRMDHWIISTWHAPSLIGGVGGHAMAGSNKQDADYVSGVHWLTPETENTCHYFAALSRSFRLDDTELDGFIDLAVTKAFTQEDMPMVAAIQKEVNGAGPEDLGLVVLSTDRGGLMARRLLLKRIQAEAREAPSPASAIEAELAAVQSS